MRRRHQVSQVQPKTVSEHLGRDQVKAVRVVFRKQIPRLLLEVLYILLLDSLDELLEQVLLKLLVVLLVRVGEGLAILREATDVADLEFLAALLEPLLDVALHVVDLLLHRGVPVVLYRVVRAAFQVCGDHGPLIVELTVQNVKNELFFLAPLVLLDFGIQMVMPAFTALFSDATG